MYFIYTSVYTNVCVCVRARAYTHDSMVYVWRSENNMEELILSFTYIGQSRDRTQDFTHSAISSVLKGIY